MGPSPVVPRIAPFLDTAQCLLTVLWIGSQWTLGYMVAPVLFAMLESRTLAGAVAGRLFSIGNFMALGCAALLLLGEWLRSRNACWRVWQTIVLVVLMGLAAFSEFGLQPELAELRGQGLSGSEAFTRLHGWSAGLYALSSLLGLVWILGMMRTRA